MIDSSNSNNSSEGNGNGNGNSNREWIVSRILHWYGFRENREENMAVPMDYGWVPAFSNKQSIDNCTIWLVIDNTKLCFKKSIIS